MKILIFHQYFLGKNDPGGSRWNQFSKMFAKTHHVVVIAGNVHYATGKRISTKRFLNKEKLSPNLTVFRSWTYAGYNKNFLGRLIGYLSYTVSSFVTGFFQKNVDLIIVTSPPLFVGVSAWFLAKIKRVPFIFEVRDLWPESAIATGVLTNNILINVMYWIEKSLYKNAHKIIALTPAFKEDISKRFPEYAPKIEIITNGADLDLMAPGPKNNWVRDQYNWQNKKVFSYFGAHGVANNLIQVINVAEKFRDRDDILFVLIGDGMQKEELKETARKLNLENIQFIDSVPKQKVQDFINASDVCMAILKKTDTFKTVYPNKVFDYMACKKPIIVTIDGITRKLIEDAQAGLFAEPENAESFKETVEKFIELDDAELEKLGQNGYSYVRKYFDRSKLAKEYLKIIENTI